jgi:RNA polymerase sigma-70 factor (ECF subfamily)
MASKTKHTRLASGDIMPRKRDIEDDTLAREPSSKSDGKAKSASAPAPTPLATPNKKGSGIMPKPPIKAAEPLPTVDELQDVESMSDEDLMKLCQEGDEGAFEVLFQRYEGQALSFIHRLIGDQSRTEALGQEAFLRIFKDAKSYQYPRSFTTWFYTIVRNLCKNELRWRSRHPTVSIEESVDHSDHGGGDHSARIGDFLRSESTDPLDGMVSREMNQKLEAALASLPELEREILILNRFQGLKYREISEVVGVPISTVRARIYSALERLRKSIKEYL